MITRVNIQSADYLHIGDARIAILNWLHAIKNKGNLCVRLPGKKGTNITDELKWLGVDFSKVIYSEDKQFLCKELCGSLISKGAAYPCIDDPFRSYRNESASECLKVFGDTELMKKGHVKLKIPSREINIQSNSGRTIFDTSWLKDCILMNKNYRMEPFFSLFVDDLFSEVTDIIQSESLYHLVPLYCILYDYMGTTKPSYTHVSLIYEPQINSDDTCECKKISKNNADMLLVDKIRDNLLSLGYSNVDPSIQPKCNPALVAHYTELGYEPNALRFYLSRLGTEELHSDAIVSDAELVEKFDLNAIHSKRFLPRLNPSQLLDINARYFNSNFDADPDKVSKEVNEFLERAGCKATSDFVKKVISAYDTGKVHNLKVRSDIINASWFFFSDKIEVNPSLIKTRFGYPGSLENYRTKIKGIKDFVNLIKKLEPFERKNILRYLVQYSKERMHKGLMLSDISNFIKLAITGNESTKLSVIDCIALAGKSKSISRITRHLNKCME